MRRPRRPPPVNYRGQTTIAERMTRLAESFPGLHGRPGVRPWEAAKLDKWAQGPEVTPNQLHAARFVLHVWNHVTRWGSGAFNMGLALSAWDEREKTVFQNWAGEPWLA